MVKRTYSDFNSSTPPPLPASGPRNLERRFATIEDNLAYINETIARLVDAQDQHDRQANDLATEKKACKHVAARVGNITGELNKVKREVATISRSMVEHKEFQQSTEAHIKILTGEVTRANQSTQAIQTKETPIEESQKDEEEEDDSEERWAPGYDDMIESLESMSRTLVAEDNARHKEYARLHDGVVVTVDKLEGINNLLHQQKHTQSRIARNSEKNSEDLTQLIDTVKNLQTAVSEQGKSIGLVLRNHTQPDAQSDAQPAPAYKKRRMS